MSDAVTIKDLYDWINAAGLPPQARLYLDGDGTLMADVPGKTAVTYLRIGFVECEETEESDLIDGIPGKAGELVFWDGRKPWWIVEWQPGNGRVFVVVDAAGTIGTAGADELTRDFRNAQGGDD
jgi:hypothetical protein